MQFLLLKRAAGTGAESSRPGQLLLPVVAAGGLGGIGLTKGCLFCVLCVDHSLQSTERRLGGKCLFWLPGKLHQTPFLCLEYLETGNICLSGGHACHGIPSTVHILNNLLACNKNGKGLCTVYISKFLGRVFHGDTSLILSPDEIENMGRDGTKTTT